MTDKKSTFRLPRLTFLILLLLFGVITGANHVIKNKLYGAECIASFDAAKKSNFADQLKLLQQNVESNDDTTPQTNTPSSSSDYGNIFGDPNLFKNFGGFDTKPD